MKQLERLLLFQGNRCFFCDGPIPQAEASVEHLVAVANGGGNDDDNCVVCCKSLNAAFGNRTYKEKLRAVLSHHPRFTCPRIPPSIGDVNTCPTTPPEDLKPRLALVVTDLQKRGKARPKKVETLRNTIAALFRKQIGEQEISALLTALRAGGYVIITENDVGYNFPPKPR